MVPQDQSLIEAAVPFGGALSSRRAWSLLEMIRRYAHFFIRLGEELGDLENCYYAAGIDPESPLTDEEIEGAYRSFEIIHRLCQDLNMEVSETLFGARRTKDAIPKTAAEFRILRDALDAELKSKVFVYVPTDRMRHFDGVIVPKNVDDQFPACSSELKHAGSCFALGEATAAVFHSMRAAEIALRALGLEMKIEGKLPKPIGQCDWQPILNAMSGSLKGIENQSGSERSSKDDDLAWYGEVITQFRAIKSAWRNRVSHARAVYTDDEARSVIDHVCELCQVVSRRLHESEAVAVT